MGMERPPRLPETSMKTMGARQRIASAAFHQSMMPPSICHVKQRYRRPMARFADFRSRERRFQESKTGLSLMKRERRKNDTIARSRASRSAALGLSEWRRLFFAEFTFMAHACVFWYENGEWRSSLRHAQNRHSPIMNIERGSHTGLPAGISEPPRRRSRLPPRLRRRRPSRDARHRKPPRERRCHARRGTIRCRSGRQSTHQTCPSCR